MKKKFAIVVLSLVCAFSLPFLLTACGDVPNGEHVHSYSWVDNLDGTHKQRCSVSGCDAPEINVENHVWGDDDKCEKCKAELSSSTHSHVWSQEWDGSETHHWHNCTADGCFVTENSQKNGYAEHDFSTGSCVCGRSQHNHVWSQEWDSNETHHWHNCTADDCFVTQNSLKSGYAEHDFSTDDCVCGKQAVYTVGLDYEYDDVGKVYTVTGLGDASDSDIIIPDYYNGYPVKYVGENSFEGEAITSVKFGKNIMQVENNAFKDCASLERVEINPKCTIFLRYCFQNCTSLKRIELPSNTSSVSQGAFYGCTSLEYASLGGLKTIVDNLFNGCSALKTVVANSLINFTGDADMFDGCASLSEFEISSKVERVSASWFEDTKLITVNNNIKYVGTWAVGFDDVAQATSALSFRSGTTGIDAYSFASDSVTDVHIPSTLKHIYGYFSKNVKKIYITDLAEYLRVKVYPYGLVSSLASGYTMYLGGTQLTNLVIPTEITEIYAGAFYNCQSITSVNIHSNVTKIGTDVFAKCSNIAFTEHNNGKYIGTTGGAMVLAEMIDKTQTSFTFATNTVAILGSAFSRSSIESIIIPNSVKTIGASAFESCQKLTSVQLPNELTEIAEFTFMNCSKLSSISVPDSVTTVCGGAFYRCSALTQFPFSANSKLEKIADASTITGSTTKTGAFDESGITQIDFPNSLTYIGSYAFRLCKSLQTLAIESSVTNIGSYAFAKCSAMTSVVINGTSQTKIGSYAFESCSNLQTADIKAYFINTGAFSKCAMLSNLTLREGLNQLSYSVFAYDVSLYSVTLPSSLTLAEKNVFNNCSKLVELQNLSNVELTKTDIPSVLKFRSATTSSAIFKQDDFVFFFDDEQQKTYLLLYEGNQAEVTLPILDGDYELFNGAFKGCAFTQVTIPQGVTVIADNAFASCKSLLEVRISASVKSISDTAFTSCDALATIEIDSNNTSYSAIGGIVYDSAKTQIVWISPNVSGCIEIPETITTIYRDTFLVLEQITQLVMKGVTRIETGAFYYLTNLNSIVVSNSLTYIGRGAFEDCAELNAVYYEGTAEQWSAIEVNDAVINETTVYFYSETNPYQGDTPATEGNFWHYDINGNPEIWQNAN